MFKFEVKTELKKDHDGNVIIVLFDVIQTTCTDRVQLLLLQVCS